MKSIEIVKETKQVITTDVLDFYNSDSSAIVFVNKENSIQGILSYPTGTRTNARQWGFVNRWSGERQYCSDSPKESIEKVLESGFRVFKIKL